MIKIAPNFYLDELIRSDTAAREGISNQPTARELINLTYTSIWLQQLRAACGNNIVHVSSGYRCKELNDLVGGSTNSQHMLGLAADFSIPGFGSIESVVQQIESSPLMYATVINEYDSWVHVSIHPFNDGPKGSTQHTTS
jgi:zinc D-Ala-D-Ala carboxypeptidase